MKSPITEELIEALYDKARKDRSKLWWRIAKELSGSSRRMTEVNVGKLAKLTKAGEWVIVPGRVLGSGELAHKLNIVAMAFSKTALDKNKGTCVTIEDFIKENKKPKAMRIIK